jgi:radical SAM protein with 4Fe4S-binding SPASM domain
MQEREIVFNHFYKLKHDLKRSYILSRDNSSELSIKVNDTWISKIHPIYGMIFSFLSEPIKLTELYKRLVYFLEIEEGEITQIILPLINNEKNLSIEYNSITSVFPRNIIIESQNLKSKIIQYIPDEFIFEELDLKKDRLYISPLTLVFMINNTCFTDCVYCYADKKYKPQLLSLDKIEEIFQNAKRLRLVDVNLTGGEFFLHKDWIKILDLLVKYDYHPGLISTKIPLTEDQIKIIKKYKLAIQISLDSMCDTSLQEILGIKNGYVEKICNTLNILEKYGVDYQIATVVTKFNDTIEDLNSIYEFIKNFKKLRRWEIRIAFRSIYGRKDFNLINVTRSSINRIDEWVNEVQKTTKINILWDNSGFDRYFKSTTGSKGFPGSRCSANYCNMIVLPDGKVTICEQLYWIPDFIIGDLSSQSIEEVWNSQRSLELASFKQENFRDKSVCKSCSIFENVCHTIIDAY